MTIICPHCQKKTVIPDDQVLSYMQRQKGRKTSERKLASCRENASKPRPKRRKAAQTAE